MEGVGEVARSLEMEQVLVGIDVSQWGGRVFTMFKHVLGVMGG